MKVLTWNVQWCLGMDGLVSPERVVATAQAMGDPDVICLQEIAVHYTGLAGFDGGDQVAAIAALLPEWEVHFGAAVSEYSRGRWMQFGNLVASRLPVRMVQNHPLPMPPDPANSASPRMCTVATVNAPGLGPVRVMSTHLEYYSNRQRLAQAQYIRRLHAEQCALHAEPPAPSTDPAGTPFQPKPWTPHAILCGDLNADITGPELRALLEHDSPDGWLDPFFDAWSCAYPGIHRPPTFRVHDKWWKKGTVSCDFALVSESLSTRVEHVLVDVDTEVSDHQPMLVELRTEG